MQLDKLPDKTRRILSELSGMSGIEDFVLIGGTALTLHLGHRQSEDLDFLYPGGKLPRKTIKEILKTLEKSYSVEDAIDLGERQTFDDGGGDLEDYQQDWLVDGVKVTFYAEDGVDIVSCAPLGKVRILGAEGVFVLKSRLLTKRLTSRDLFDLWRMLEDETLGKDIGDIIAHACAADPHYDEDRVKQRLLKAAPRRPDPEFKPSDKNAPQSMEEVRARLADFFDLYEESRAMEIRRAHTPPQVPSSPSKVSRTLQDILIDGMAMPAAKLLLKLYFGDGVAGAAEGLLGIAKKKIKAYSDQRRAERLFADLGQRVVENLLPSFKAEVDKSSFNAEAMAGELAATLEAGVSSKLLLAKDLDPQKIIAALRRKRPFPKKKYSQAEADFYDEALNEAVRYLVETASALPDFHARAVSETLKRMSRMGDDIDEVLEKARRIEHLETPPEVDEESQRQETDYRHMVTRKLDYMELFGADIPKESRNHSLSVAYVSLNLEDPDGGEEGMLTLPAAALLNNLERTGGRLLIRGDAGMGKSTLLRWAAIQAAEGETQDEWGRQDKLARRGGQFSHRTDGPRKTFPDNIPFLMDIDDPFNPPDALTSWRARVPFLVRLRDIKDGKLPNWKDLPDMIADQPWETSGDWVKEVLDERRALILLDGVDEVPNVKRDRIKSHLSDYLSRFPGNFFVVTTRPAAVPENWLSGLDFNEARIAPMTAMDRERFIEKWHDSVQQELARQGRFEDLGGVAATLKSKLPEAPSLSRLATNPLMCAMICALHRNRDQKLPESEAELCETLTHMLLHRRERETPGLDMEAFPPAYRDLDYLRKRFIVREIAGNMLINGASSIDRQACESLIAKTLENLMHCDAKDARTILDGLIERSGMLRESVPGVNEFIHNTFKEFLGADWHARHRNEKLLASKAGNPDWQPVLRFAAASDLPGFADSLMELILNVPKGAGKDDLRARQILALQCASSGLQASPELKAQLAKIENGLFPPRNMGEAEALARVGDSAVPFLKRRANIKARQAAACVRALRLIATPAAGKALETYKTFKWKTVYTELAQAVDPLTIPAILKMVKAGKKLPFDIAAQVTDLTPLAGIRELQTLYLARTRVTDLTPLAGIPGLQTLDLWGTRVTDLTPLAGIPGLQTLNLGVTQVSDLTPLAGIPGLQTLDLARTQVTDLTPLAGLPGLQTLDLGGTRVTDLTPLAGLRELQTLYLGGTQVTDLTPLAGLRELQTLYLARTRVTDLTPLAGLRELQTLYLARTRVTDLTPLAGLPGLQTLYLWGTRVTDLTPLAGLPGLQTLYLRGTEVSDLGPLEGRVGLKIIR